MLSKRAVPVTNWCNKRKWLGYVIAVLLGATWGQSAHTSKSSADSTPLLHTGGTGQITASGLNDPQYVLSFVPVQRLMLAAVRHPLMQAEIQTGLHGTPVSLENLLKLNFLRQDGIMYRLNYLLLTVQDQKTMYGIGERFGQSLGKAFQVHQAEFDRILKGYPNTNMRRQLLFDLVAGAALNWDGLDLTTEMGYRVKPPHHPNGDVYFVRSEERGAEPKRPELILTVSGIGYQFGR